MLVFNEVTLRFPGADYPLLERVSLELSPGTITSLLGPNGAGKTTLLKLSCGLIEATSGTVTVAGHDVVVTATQARRMLGVSLYPERSFYYRLTCRQNLRYYSALRGIFGRECRLEVSRVLQLLDLDDVADLAFMHLSLGQRRRIGVARSLLGSPPLVLLDEPTASLDDTRIDQLHQALSAYRQEGGTVLLSTHLARDFALSTDQLHLADHKIRHES